MDQTLTAVPRLLRMGAVAEVPVVQVNGRLLRTARIRNEWFADVVDLDAVLTNARQGQFGRADIFSFWNRPGSDAPSLGYHWEPEAVAALPVSTYDAWWTRQIDGKTRNLVRKGEKSGLTVRTVPFDDELVAGIAKVFNETPVRQGRPFWHYGKNRSEVRSDMADRLDVSVFIAAYVGSEFVGFVKLLVLDNYAMMVQIISELRHRDKAPNNALVAAAVKECALRRIPLLTYSTWGSTSLAAFKESNGFSPLCVQRYYVPLTIRGRIALALRLHRGLRPLIPERLLRWAKTARLRWYTWRSHGFAPRFRPG